MTKSAAWTEREVLDLYGPWFKHPVTGKFVDSRHLPKEKSMAEEKNLARDALMIDPRLVEIVEGEAKRLSRALHLDVVDSKEVYRSMVSASINVVLAVMEDQGEVKS